MGTSPFELGLSTAVRERVGMRAGDRLWTLVWAWRIQLESGEFYLVFEDTGDAVAERRASHRRAR